MLCLLTFLGCDIFEPRSDDFAPSYTIVYASLDGYIYSINADGSENRKLFETPASFPSVSPDGQKVIAHWWDTGKHEEWLVLFDVNIKTMEKIAFVKSSGETGIITQAWSPDGRSIAFNRTQGFFSRSDIFIVDIQAKEVRQLTNTGFNYDPQWSPDGKKIAYATFKDSILSIYIMNKDGSAKSPAYFRGEGLVRHMSWSLDGKLVAVDGPGDSSQIRTTYNDIFISNVEEKSVKRVTFDGASGAPSWSPMSDRMVFASRRDGGFNLYIMNADGSNQVKLTYHGKVGGGPFFWSPDGKKILYAYDPGGGVGITLGVIEADGSKDINTRVPLLWGFGWRQK